MRAQKLFWIGVIFLVSLAFWGCGNETTSANKQLSIFVAPSTQVVVSQPLKRLGYPILIANPNDEPLKVKSVAITDERQITLQTEEIGGIRYFYFENSQARYYMRLRIKEARLVNGALTPFYNSSLAAKVVAKSGSLCDLANLQPELYTLNRCDLLSFSLLVEQLLIRSNTGYELSTTQEETFHLLLSAAAPDFEGYAKKQGIKVCNSTEELSGNDIKLSGPYDTENIFDENGQVDEAKLLEFCEKETGTIDETKLSLLVKDLKISALPLELVAWAEAKEGITEIPSETFYIKVEHDAESKFNLIRIDFNTAATGKPVAQFTLDPQAGVKVLSALKIDASESYSPAGADRLPLEFNFSLKPLFDNALPTPVLTQQTLPETHPESLTNQWISEAVVYAFPLLVGEYSVSVKVRDNQHLESDTTTQQIEALPQGRLYVELSWDKENALLELYLVRYRRHGTFDVPSVEDDLISPPTGIDCRSDADCNNGYCSALPSGDLKCTFHSEAAHYDTCGPKTPNPVWGDPTNPDDDPRYIVRWSAPGPISISVPRPADGRYRVVVKLLPESSRTITKQNPTTARIAIYARNESLVLTQALYFRPESPDVPDIPIWKVADITFNGEETSIEQIPVRDQDCYIPGQCPYANPLNAVVDRPFDPQDNETPRSIWCDKEGDVECVE